MSGKWHVREGTEENTSNSCVIAYLKLALCRGKATLKGLYEGQMVKLGAIVSAEATAEAISKSLLTTN